MRCVGCSGAVDAGAGGAFATVDGSSSRGRGHGLEVPRVRPGGMCRSGSGSGTRSISASRAGPRTAPGRSFSPRCRSSPTRPGSSTGWCRSTRPSRACISTVRPSAATQGALSNHKILREEPLDHGIGRSRGGLTSKVHLVCDGRGRPLSWVITGGNINDTTMLAATLDQIRVARPVGRPRQRPDRVIADEGYPSKKNRAWLRERKIAATIPERDDQIAHRRKKPGRPIEFGDEQKERYKGRKVVERCFNKLKQWRGIAMRQTESPAPTVPRSPSPQR